MTDKNILFNSIFDKVEYKSKPNKGEQGPITNRMAASEPVLIDVMEFATNIAKGKTYVSGNLIDKSRGIRKENIENINFFSLDVDNHYVDVDKKSIYTNYSIKSAKELVFTAFGIMPIIVYTTFSGTNIENGSERFRMIYQLENNIDATTLSNLLCAIMNKIPNIFDENCTDASRKFLGTNKKPKIFRDNITLLTGEMKNIVHEYQEQQLKLVAEEKQAREIKQAENAKKYANNNCSNNGSGFNEYAIDQLKQIDIHDYLGVSNKGNICCPIHGGKDKNFSIHYTKEAWKVTCHSRGCVKGGSIIDLHMALNNISEGEAIKQLCNMYNIEQFAPKPVTVVATKTDGNIEIYIYKYISDNDKNVKIIIDVIKKWFKILITGAMGCGKTHFIINEVHEYAKSINKKVIIVSPSLKQIENLKENKNINKVCDGVTYDEKDTIVTTTPESVLKVTDEIGPGNYILIVDESHERVLSLSYRVGYQKDNIGKAEKTAFRVLHLTATPRPLIFDTFDSVITVKSKTVIKDKIKIVRTKNNNADEIYSIVTAHVREGKQVILRNNDIEQNEVLRVLLEEKKEFKVYEFGEEQLSMFKKSEPKEIIKTELITSAETVKSGKEVKEVTTGLLTSDIIITTCCIQAGIDLYTKNDAVLIVNCKNIKPDDLIQLIGRFRKGIEIILAMPNTQEKAYIDLVSFYNSSMDKFESDCNIANSNEMMKELYEGTDGLKKGSFFEKGIDGKYFVNKIAAMANIYNIWSRSIMSNPKSLISILKNTNAFEIDGEIEIIENIEPVGTVLADIQKNLKAKKSEIIENSKEVLLKLDNAELEKILTKKFNKLEFEKNILDQVELYNSVAKKHIEKIDIVAKELFTDEKGTMSKAEAFRHFYSNTFTDITKEIEQKHTREVNRKIKEHGGIKEYLRFNSKTCKEVIQAKIRFELMELEKKRGRLTSDKITALTETLITGGYIRNSSTKLYLKADSSLKDKERAFELVGKTVKSMVIDIYNFKNNDNISSVKY